MVIMFVPLAGMITAPLSGFILAAYDWHHLFFSAGALSLLCLVVWLMFADDGPETARWVSPRERPTSSTRCAKSRNARPARRRPRRSASCCATRRSGC